MVVENGTHAGLRCTACIKATIAGNVFEKDIDATIARPMKIAILAYAYIPGILRPKLFNYIDGEALVFEYTKQTVLERGTV